MTTSDVEPAPRKFRLSLMHQIMIGLVLGCLLGWLKPDWATNPAVVVVRDIFLQLIKCIIAPLIFRFLPQGVKLWGLRKYYGI